MNERLYYVLKLCVPYLFIYLFISELRPPQSTLALMIGGLNNSSDVYMFRQRKKKENHSSKWPVRIVPAESSEKKIIQIN